MGDGKPDRSVRRLGKELKRLRRQRNWSRSDLLLKLAKTIPHDDPLFDYISESWITRLEEGRMVKVSRECIESLSKALKCSRLERCDLFVYADRNFLVNDDGSFSNMNKILVKGIVHLSEYKKSITTLIRVLHNIRMSSLSDDDIFVFLKDIEDKINEKTNDYVNNIHIPSELLKLIIKHNNSLGSYRSSVEDCENFIYRQEYNGDNIDISVGKNELNGYYMLIRSSSKKDFDIIVSIKDRFYVSKIENNQCLIKIISIDEVFDGSGINIQIFMGGEYGNNE